MRLSFIVESNVTLKLNDSLLKQARKVAVDEDTSLSAWVAGLIVQQLRKRDAFRTARRKALAALESGFDLKPGRFTRDELHER
jgi:hypothetical protein